MTREMTSNGRGRPQDGFTLSAAELDALEACKSPAALLYLHARRRADGGQFRAGHRQLAEALPFGLHTIRTAVQQLQDAGLWQLQRRGRQHEPSTWWLPHAERNRASGVAPRATPAATNGSAGATPTDRRDAHSATPRAAGGSRSATRRQRPRTAPRSGGPTLAEQIEQAAQRNGGVLVDETLDAIAAELKKRRRSGQDITGGVETLDRYASERQRQRHRRLWDVLDLDEAEAGDPV